MNWFSKRKNKHTKVLVGLSGGVDSSVTAALLKKQGYDVTGAYMKQWSDSKNDQGVCTWKEDRRDALAVAAHLDIPFLTLDFEKEYKEWVMGYMFREYKAGRTPNPDVMCNRFIKFGAWLDKAKELGFDYLATGHYASIGTKGDTFTLKQAKDDNKDQTYFLHQLTSEQLAHTLFPLGAYTKPEVRKMAKTFALPTANRAESMGICFIGKVPMKSFLQQQMEKTPGNILFADGSVVGEHEGVSFYTIGQRHGFSVDLQKIPFEKGHTRPLFVVEKRIETNELVVGFNDDSRLHQDHLVVEDMHFVSGQPPTFPLHCQVRIRHRQPLQDAILTRHDDGSLHIKTNQLLKAVTPGQFAVVYSKQTCIGGGPIL